jgi:hypothetical protein
MEAEELRIGNLVEYKLMYCDVFEIKTKTISVTAASYAENFEDKIEEFKPILLTKEWLLKFGFINIVIRSHTKWFRMDVLSTRFYLRPCFSGGFYWGFDMNEAEKECEFNDVREFKYVHELQNFYYIITGKELTH